MSEQKIKDIKCELFDIMRQVNSLQRLAAQREKELVQLEKVMAAAKK